MQHTPPPTPGKIFPQSTEETVPDKGKVTNKNYKSHKDENQTEQEYNSTTKRMIKTSQLERKELKYFQFEDSYLSSILEIFIL